VHWYKAQTVILLVSRNELHLEFNAEDNTLAGVIVNEL